MIARCMLICTCYRLFCSNHLCIDAIINLKASRAELVLHSMPHARLISFPLFTCTKRPLACRLLPDEIFKLLSIVYSAVATVSASATEVPTLFINEFVLDT